jgi:23S rRNA (pseudouridine1915-N3)-methyltransferase
MLAARARKMKILVVAVGQRMPAWVDAGFEEYARRMPREAQITLVEIRPEPRGSAADARAVERHTRAEAHRIRAALPRNCYKVALDERGSAATTRELGDRLAGWQMGGCDVAFIIGGPDGLYGEIKREADWLWSLSPLTLPHGLVRVVLAEQLYRALSILRNHPYHRD